MTRKIAIVLMKNQVRTVAELHEDLAPKTCKAIWESLPHEGEMRHAKWCGNEIWTMVKPTQALKEVPRENITIYPQPGDVTYGYFPPAWEGGFARTEGTRL